MTNGNFKSNNSATFDSFRAKTLENAYVKLINVVQKYAEMKNLPPHEAQEIKKLIHNAYLKKKAEYFLNAKLRQLESRFEKALGLALGQSPDSNQNLLDKGYHSTKQINQFDNYEPF